MVVGRALTGQIGTFLSAARRLARGDFAHPVPVNGRDEFAQLGREFNSMSSQLEAKIEEIERKRQELEETIRRVGDALATGLDRDGVVALAVRPAVDACEAESGRALPVASGAFHEVAPARRGRRLDAGLEAAEERASESPRVAGAAARGRRRGARRSRHRDPDARGRERPSRPSTWASSRSRAAGRFARDEEELLEYLAGQAIVSIENASLHELVDARRSPTS